VIFSLYHKFLIIFGRWAICFLICQCGRICAEENAGEKLAETRSLLEEWVRTETLISEEASQWQVQKRILQDIAEVAHRELSILEKGLGNVQESLTKGETAKDSLLERQEELKTIVQRIEIRLPVLEASLLERLEWFPNPLRQKVALYEKRLPRPNGEKQKPNFLIRAQNLAVILREADEFNGRVTLDKPTMDIGDSGARVYNVLYFGLAVAYFVDETGKIAGVGIPAKGGWRWQRQDRIAPIVEKAVEIRKNERLAEFLNLPFELEAKSPQ